MKRVFAFADFTFDPGTGTLTRKNRSSRLPEKSARLLQALLERPNALVSREELRHVLWPGEEFLDYDQGINVVVNRLRNTLRESSRQADFLKTIPKRGYSFCAEVHLVSAQAAEPPRLKMVPTVPALPLEPALLMAPQVERLPPVEVLPPSLIAPVHPPRRRRFAASLLLACLALLAAAWLWTAHRAHAAPSPVRLGVSPLRAEGSPPPTGAAESFRLELSDALSRLPGVQVPAASAFEGANADVSRIAKELRLNALLLGSLTREGGQYDLKFELVRASDAIHLASFEYSGTPAELPALSQRLQQDVFHYLRAGGAPASVQAMGGSTDDPQAYELYLRGNYHALERRPAALRQSVQEYEQALARDPNFAAAYAGMATAQLKLSSYPAPSTTTGGEPPLSLAVADARKAIALDPMLAQAHAVLGSAVYKQDRNFSLGESELRTAIQLDGQQAAYRNWIAVLLAEEGRFDEATQQLDAARERAPFWPSVYATESLVGVDARQNGYALAAAHKYADLLPNLPVAHDTLAWVSFETGHVEDAIAQWRQMAQLQGDAQRLALEQEGLQVFRKEGVRGYARLRLRAIAKGLGARQSNDFMPAEWYACAGENQKALDQLAQLAEAHDPYMVRVGVDPIYDPLHNDPRFRAILAKAGVSVPASLQGVNTHICQ